jgi:hypothetical protein
MPNNEQSVAGSRSDGPVRLAGMVGAATALTLVVDS